MDEDEESWCRKDLQYTDQQEAEGTNRGVGESERAREKGWGGVPRVMGREYSIRAVSLRFILDCEAL